MITTPDISARTPNHHPDPGSEQSGLPTATQRRRLATNKKAAKSFEIVMAEITHSMPAHKRLFSRFIHLKAIASISDIIGSTLARPDALLSGGIFSFALTLFIYIVAKNLGYTLSGFESIAAFMLGWTLGLVYDFLKLMITGKH